MADPRQLTLDWPHAASLAREDFLVAPNNAAAMAAIDGWRDWVGGIQGLIGPGGSGKSHLGAVWASEAGAHTVSGPGIGTFELSQLDSSPRVFIDDAAAVGGCEVEFFHLLNAARERNGAVLFAARTVPDRWGLKTPDLLSRLRLAPLAELGAPDLDLMRAVLFKLFADRQIAVDGAVVAYLAPRLERSIAAARSIVEALDREAMALGRRVTRAVAAEVLARHEPRSD